MKKTANPVKKGTVLGEYAGLVQDKHRLTNTLSNVKDEDEENEKDDISLMDEEYLMTLQTTVDAKYYNTIKKGSYAVVNARVYRNEMGFINDFRGCDPRHPTPLLGLPATRATNHEPCCCVAGTLV